MAGFYRINTMKKHLYIFVLLLFVSSSVTARGIYQKPANFLDEVFNSKPPQANVIWLTGSIRTKATEILNHKPTRLRIRYWNNQQRTAWILEEIGKEKPITVGIVISNNKIEKVKVLVFRESRGDEIRHDFFTQQFKHARLNTNNQLDRSIDGISGATLSVRALTKLTRLALFLSTQIKQ